MEHKCTRCGKVPCGVVVIALTLILGYGFIMSPAMTQPAASWEAGQQLFGQSCVACHTLGQGDRVGPDLKDVVEKRDRDWLIRWLLAPDQLLAEGDPLAVELLQQYNNVPMPNLRLTQDQVANLIAYMQGVAEPAPPPQQQSPPAQAVLSSGDPAAGMHLFTGSIAFQNGGPTCMACHSIVGNGALGGGTLGPDLTKVHSRYGEGLLAVLKSLPFPTMQGVFTNKPLTEDEVAHLYAYFVLTDQIAPQPVSFNFVWIGLGTFILLSLLCHLIWSKRLMGVRKPLLRGTK